MLFRSFSPGGGSCSGTGSTEDPVFRLECTVEAMDGQQLSWRVHTSDGVTGDMWIGDQPYDLSQGAMFLVSAGEGGLQIEQHQRDLSTLEPITSAITALIDSDPEVAAFVAGKSRGSEETEAGEAFGLEELSAALHLADHVVTVAGEVTQPFFSVPGRIVKVDGEDVQVFVYPDVAAAGTEAALIAPDASSVGTSMVTWMATPHFFQRDHLIVLYVEIGRAHV